MAGAAPPAAARQPAASELDLSSFARVLDELAQKTAAATPDDAAALRASLPGSWRVRVGDEVVDVSARTISLKLHRAQDDPATWPSRRQELAAHVRRLSAETAALGAGAERPPHDEAAAALEDVLARGEFQRSATSVWLERLRDRIAGWLADLFQRLGRRGPDRRTVAIVFAWTVGLLALVALAWWLVSAIVGAPGAHRLGLTPARPKRRTSGAWARLALAAHHGGDPREVTRCGYHAAVCRIEEEGAWTVDETLTPREYLRLLPPAHRRRSLLADVTGRFERVWYGAAVPTPDDSRRVLATLKDLGCLASDQAI